VPVQLRGYEPESGGTKYEQKREYGSFHERLLKG
jgi:hypothetical protein